MQSGKSISLLPTLADVHNAHIFSAGIAKTVLLSTETAWCLLVHFCKQYKSSDCQGITEHTLPRQIFILPSHHQTPERLTPMHYNECIVEASSALLNIVVRA